jgi:hypothetical protein
MVREPSEVRRRTAAVTTSIATILTAVAATIAARLVLSSFGL